MKYSFSLMTPIRIVFVLIMSLKCEERHGGGVSKISESRKLRVFHQWKLHGSHEPERQGQVDDDDDCQDEQQPEQAATSPAGQCQDQSGLGFVDQCRIGAIGRCWSTQPVVSPRWRSVTPPGRSFAPLSQWHFPKRYAVVCKGKGWGGGGATIISIARWISIGCSSRTSQRS